MPKSKREIEKLIKDAGCVFIRHGGKHDIWRNPATGKNIVLSHGGIKNSKRVLNGIYKRAGIKKPR